MKKLKIFLLVLGLLSLGYVYSMFKTENLDKEKHKKQPSGQQITKNTQKKLFCIVKRIKFPPNSSC